MECTDRFGEEIFPNRPELAKALIWVCPYCGARVGSHPDGKPLGTAANPELRKARVFVHEKLDPIWQKASQLPDYQDAHRGPEAERRKALAIIKRTARVRTYRWLAHHMGLSRDACHVGMMDLEQCRTAYRRVRYLSYEEVRDWCKANPDPEQSEKASRPKGRKAQPGSGSAKSSRSHGSSPQ